MRILSPSEPISLEYEERVLAYIDILGWRELIKEIAKDNSRRLELWHILKFAHSFAGQGSKFKDSAPSPNSIQASVFSDLIVLTAKVEDLSNLADEVVKLAQILLSRGFPCRGAIVKGSIYHENTIIFGQALVDAYEIESKVAKYPRIVVTNVLVDKLQSLDCSVQKDRDGIYHIDYLSKSAPPAIIRACGDRIKKLIGRFKQQAHSTSEATTLDVLMELNWLDNYHK